MHLEQCLTHCLLNYTEKTTYGTCLAEFQIRAGLNVIVQMLFCLVSWSDTGLSEVLF